MRLTAYQAVGASLAMEYAQFPQEHLPPQVRVTCTAGSDISAIVQTGLVNS